MRLLSSFPCKSFGPGWMWKLESDDKKLRVSKSYRPADNRDAGGEWRKVDLLMRKLLRALSW